MSDKQDVLRYTKNARSIRYKQMAIIYIVQDTVALIKAVIPMSMIRK